MTEKILCVDDEPNVVTAYQRALRKEFQIETATSGALGLDAIEGQGPYAVIVTDMQMPGMDGVQFLAQVKEKSPNSIRIMLTGNADQHTAIEAVNEGNIFRFLTKPCPPEALAKALKAGLQQYRLVMAEKELLEKTLSSSIQVLTEILSLINPTAFSRASRVRRLVRELAAKLQIEQAWQTEIAAMLSQIGCITLPEEILVKVYRGASLTPDELRLMQSHPQTGQNLIKHIPRLEPVAEIIAYQEKCFNGVGLPHDGKRGLEIPLGARILKLALDFDKLLEGKINHLEALKEIQRRGDWYDPSVVEALKVIVTEGMTYETRAVHAHELALGMILAEDVVTKAGLLLIASGQDVTSSLYLRVQNYAERGMITDSIKVLIPVIKGEAATTVLAP